MRIAVDAMGGDDAPREVVAGAFQVATRNRISILLVGDEAKVGPELEKLGDHGGRIVIHHAEEVVGMEDTATAPIRKKKRSSIRLCAELVHRGEAQAMVSAGNTGAVMIAAKMIIGTIPGVDRPALAAAFPNPRGRTVVLDVGANVETRPAYLRQFAVMGHSYAQAVHHLETPRIGLMSIGEEDSKGTDTTRETLRVLKTTGLNFVGNVEGRDVFNGEVDVIVCDGFVGNVLLKSAEAMAEQLKRMLYEELDRSPQARLGAKLAGPALRRLARRTDYREYGGAPLLGLCAGCFIAHGSSNARAIQNSILRAVEFTQARVHEKIRDKVAVLHDQEALLLSSTEAGPDMTEPKAEKKT